MPLKTADTRDAVPEALRTAAVETKDGKFVYEEVDPTLGDAGKKALQDERDARRREADARKAAEKERDDLKVAADAKEKGITKEQLDEIRAKEALARKPLEDENAALKVKLRKATLTDRLEALLLKAGAIPARVPKAMKDLEGRVDLTEDGGGFVVKDPDGKVTSETIEDFLGKTYKTEAPFFYAGPGGSGSSADASDGGGGGGYDPVAAGKAKAKAQVGAREERAVGLT